MTCEFCKDRGEIDGMPCPTCRFEEFKAWWNALYQAQRDLAEVQNSPWIGRKP